MGTKRRRRVRVLSRRLVCPRESRTGRRRVVESCVASSLIERLPVFRQKTMVLYHIPLEHTSRKKLYAKNRESVTAVPRRWRQITTLPVSLSNSKRHLRSRRHICFNHGTHRIHRKWEACYSVYSVYSVVLQLSPKGNFAHLANFA